MVGPAKDKHQAPANRLKLTHHRAIKGEKIARNRDCVYNQACRLSHRLISVVDVVITPMNPYQPIPFHILSLAVFQSRILIYAGSNI